jgi:glycosyltransferase involved in cell wall biosynthesis
MANTLYSLLIPTRNRPATATCLIRHALGFLPENCEIVVQDCGDPRSLRDMLGGALSDVRLRYEHTGRPVSMTENWNRGMDRCRGEYVSVLGDDDAASEELPSVVEWMQRSGIDLLIANSNRSMYRWPDFPEAASAGAYAMHGYTGELINYASSSLLSRAVRTLGYSEVRGLPRVYHGIVRRVYLRRMAERTGRYFHGYTPDFYSAFFLAATVPRTHWVDYPIFIAGICGSSNAAKDSGVTHIKEYENESWPDIVPEGSFIPVFVAEGVVRGLRDAGHEELVTRIRWADFYLLCMFHEPAMRRRNLARYWAMSGSLLGRSRPQRVGDLAAGLVRRARGKIFRRQGYLEPEFAAPVRPVVERYSGVRDTTELMSRVSDALRRQGIVPPWRSGSPGEARAIE